VTISAILYLFCVAGLVVFQLSLAAGLPRGKLAIGGRFSGAFPVGIRIVAVAIAILFLGIASLVLARAELAFAGVQPVANQLAWPVVFLSLASFVMNLITPSRAERNLWGPVTAVMLASSMVLFW
jgi:hypothetical protein